MSLESKLVALVVTAGLLALSALAPAADRTYTVSDSPDDEVLSIRWSCGDTPEPTLNYALYGDGRLVRSLKGCHPSSRNVGPDLERRVTSEEVEAIVDAIVEAGLVEFEESDLRKRLKPSTSLGEVVDGSSLSLRISLRSYSSVERKEAEPFVYATSVYAPEYYIGQYQDARKAGGLARGAPETFVEAEALLRLYNQLERRFLRE